MESSGSINWTLWGLIAVAVYIFSRNFRREVNGYVIRLAAFLERSQKHDKQDTRKSTHIIEDIAFAIFKEEQPEEAKRVDSWHSLSFEDRKLYTQKAMDLHLRTVER